MGLIMDINTRSSGIIDSLHEYPLHILGCGAIGSSAATQLVRMGATQFILYDMDNVESVNVGVSQYDIEDIGLTKVEALKKKLLAINNECLITTIHGLFDSFCPINDKDIVILGFDSMQSRLDAVSICLKNKIKLLIDGRMGAEHYQQYTFVKPNYNKYVKTWYNDDEGSSEQCNMKATSYCSNMSGSFIANTIRKVLKCQPYEVALSFNFPTMTLQKNTCYKS
jgi:molybdopterin/thiamine biosynthesis adenylyltransferase